MLNLNERLHHKFTIYVCAPLHMWWANYTSKTNVGNYCVFFCKASSKHLCIHLKWL